MPLNLRNHARRGEGRKRRQAGPDWRNLIRSPPVAAEKLGAEQRSDPRHAQRLFRRAAWRRNRAATRCIDLRDLLVEGDHLQGQRLTMSSVADSPGTAPVLPFARRPRPLPEASATDAAGLQPTREPGSAETAQGCRSLVAGQQYQRTGVGHFQGAFQAGEHAGEGGAEAVDRRGPVADQVRSAAGEQSPVRSQFHRQDARG